MMKAKNKKEEAAEVSAPERNEVAVRMQEYLDYRNLTGYQMEKLTGKGRGYWAKCKNPNVDFVSRFLETFDDLSAEWLLRGNGSMLKSESNGVSVTRIGEQKTLEKILPEVSINLYDMEAAANLSSLVGDSRQNIIGRIVIPNVPKCDGAIYVRGDSMYPTLKSGDIVAFQITKVSPQTIMWGEMYIVDLSVDGDDFLVVKFVEQSEQGDGWVKLRSSNPAYAPKDFPLACVRSMAIVKLSVRMNTMG